MMLKELTGVLLGTVILCEKNPGKDMEDPGTWYRDLYSGNIGSVPQEYLHREVKVMYPKRGQHQRGGGCTDIILRQENGA
ncbi:MAG: hypothetical protein NC489_25535 [Ruminococcus flavefaciens]|nr:hypothetical protein [Ruminococcus flavefaciens]